MADLYDIARQVTDEVLGEGAYAAMNQGNPDPGVQRAIKYSPGAAITPHEARKGDASATGCAVCHGSKTVRQWSREVPCWSCNPREE